LPITIGVESVQPTSENLVQVRQPVLDELIKAPEMRSTGLRIVGTSLFDRLGRRHLTLFPPLANPRQYRKLGQPLGKKCPLDENYR
jgi:hypothetical protein